MEPFYDPTPDPFPIETEIIAPLWSPVNTRRGSGTIWYREATEQADLNRAQQEIRDIFPEARNFVARLVFIATWDHVGYYSYYYYYYSEVSSSLVYVSSLIP